MIADGLIKALMSANHKAFIKIICLADQGEPLASIKLKKDQKNNLLLCGAEQKSKVFRYKANTS